MTFYIVGYAGAFKKHDTYEDAKLFAHKTLEETGFTDRPLVVYQVEQLYCVNPGNGNSDNTPPNGGTPKAKEIA